MYQCTDLRKLAAIKTRILLPVVRLSAVLPVSTHQMYQFNFVWIYQCTDLHMYECTICRRNAIHRMIPLFSN